MSAEPRIPSMSVIPRYYSVEETTTTCACGDITHHSAIFVAHDLPQNAGQALNLVPLHPRALLYKVPIKRVVITRSIPYCTHCFLRAIKLPLPETPRAARDTLPDEQRVRVAGRPIGDLSNSGRKNTPKDKVEASLGDLLGY